MQPNMKKFKKQLHKAMSMNRVNADDLAVLMGKHWGHWLFAPGWNKTTGWFNDTIPYPDDPAEQQRILDLCASAHSNPMYWKRKYYHVKSYAKIHYKGLWNKNWHYERMLKEMIRYRSTSLTYAWEYLMYKGWKVKNWLSNPWYWDKRISSLRAWWKEIHEE